MATIQEMNDAEKAALQNEFKYYSDLLAAHSAKLHSQLPKDQSRMPKNNAVSNCNTFKTSSNYMHHYKSTSFQPKTHLPYQNSKVIANYPLHRKIDLSTKFKVPNSCNLTKHPCKSSLVKVNSSVLSDKSIKPAEKTLEHNNLLKKTLSESRKQITAVVANKPSGSRSQVLMNEIIQLTNQLKQRTKYIDKKVSHVSSKPSNSLFKSAFPKPEFKATIKVPTDSKVICKTLNNINQTIEVKDQTCKNLSSVDSSILPLSKCSNSCVADKNEHAFQGKLVKDINDTLVKPFSELKNCLPQSNHGFVKIPSKPINKISHNLLGKFENPEVLQVNNTFKTPVKIKLIRKSPNNAKRLSGTTLFASKYKVVNRKFSPPQLEKKINLVSPKISTPLKIKSVKKHISSVKRIMGESRLITSKYKIINKKIPSDQPKNHKKYSQRYSGYNACNLRMNDKWTGLKTNGAKLKTTKLNSKYKIVNKNEKLATMPTSLFLKQNISPKKSKSYSFSHQGNKHPHKFHTSNLRKNIYSTSKLIGERKIMKCIDIPKQNHLHSLNLKRKKLSPSQNSFISSSKYRTVNKQPSSSLKKVSQTVVSCNLKSDQNSSIDLDLLMELAAEKKSCNDCLVTNSINKHVLIKRVYKSKNTIVNKNICSLQIKAAKMIKTKYSILNKKHSWQRQSFTKRIVSPKSFKGHKFNSNYQRRRSYFHNQRNKRNNFRYKNHHVSTYFTGRSYSRAFLVSRNKNIAFGSPRSVFKTPKRFVLNRKVCLKTPNTKKLVSPVSKTMASRALNRSINRVLNASAKKRTSKVNIYCMFYNRFGRCNKGIKCPYVHDPSKIAVCTRFLRGTCKTKNCPFSHEICPGKMAICSFFLLGSCTKIDCPYRHETLSPNAKLCKAFVQGYCPDGKQCKQAHVLVCPQFVQGHCQKGDECPFPHPPPKEKKTIPNPSEKIENLEETELILEKVSRYFECENESVSSDKTNINSIAVPRRRNLPEQPSFIAL